MEESNIADFFSGRSVFITGATGFMGKVLVEKLLRSCPNIKCLYLLIRPSKGKDAMCRLQELINNQIFDLIRADNCDVFTKLVAIEGDVTKPVLGLSSTDSQLLTENATIVFNLAATVRFDEDLRTASTMNVKGPRRLLQLCHQMDQLEAFVHVSTAFNNLHLETVDEIIYPGATNAIKLADFIDAADDKLLQSISKELVGNCPNTYTYTKALAEQVLEIERGKVPLTIVRPSIVAAAAKEPFPGWIDHINGPTGLIAGGGTGFIRIFKSGGPNFITDLIPVDYAINLMIAVAWETAVNRPLQIPVYTISTSHNNPLSMRLFRKYGFNAWKRYPSKYMNWYPNPQVTNRNWYYKINVWLFHIFPASLLDVFRLTTGQRPKWVRLYMKAFRALAVFDYFFTRHWTFICSNKFKLWGKLSDCDRHTFYFNVKDIDWPNYFETYVLGTRQYIFKESLDAVPEAKKKFKRLYFLRILMNVLLYIFILYLVYAVIF